MSIRLLQRTFVDFFKNQQMFFVAVLCSLLTYLYPTALQPNYLSITVNYSYDESINVLFRQNKTSNSDQLNEGRNFINTFYPFYSLTYFRFG